MTLDLLRCNRCGKCVSVCPVYDVYNEEWASARGKVELAEAFFRGDQLDEREFQKVFDLCLHCMTCQENCPSGMRANEVVMAVRAEMAGRGLIPAFKKVALRMIESMDSIVFRAMRMLGLARKAPLHGSGGRGPLSFLYPLIGWSSSRTLPLPAGKPFLSENPGFFPASELDRLIPSSGKPSALEIAVEGPGNRQKAAELIDMIAAARAKNLENKRSVYFYIGHTVNQFFPEEAEKVIWLLNLAGVDVHVPKDQICCGAPYFYSGDIESSRRVAKDVIAGFSGYSYDWIVTTCSSGGMMLKAEYPRLFDINSDGFFKIDWDSEPDIFTRRKDDGSQKDRFEDTVRLYRENIEGKVRDINELIAEMLGLKREDGGFNLLFARERAKESARGSGDPGAEKEDGDLPVVTYHHPCHLNRGQGINWQPEAILGLLYRYRYEKMPDAERCCGGGGTFTFAHAEASGKISSLKADSIEAVDPGMVATSCPLCRIQLTDAIKRRFVIEAKERGEVERSIPVTSPAELLAEDLRSLLER